MAGWRERWYEVIFEAETRAGKTFDAKLGNLYLGSKDNGSSGLAKGVLKLASDSTIDATTIIVSRSANNAVDAARESQIILGDGTNDITANVFRIGGKKPTLRFFIDKDGGVSVDDCAEVSRQLSALLDEKVVPVEVFGIAAGRRIDMGYCIAHGPADPAYDLKAGARIEGVGYVW